MIHGWSALGGLTMTEWENELERWLKPFLDRLGHKTRQRMCPLYVAGLIGPGDRKSVQPMAERLATGNYDQLHHFIADGVWDAKSLAPYARQAWMALASIGRSERLPLSTSTNSFTSDQLPPFRKSATALRCASMPSPDFPCLSVETRRYETHFPTTMVIL
jgi:DDE superfamily endonuclease